MSTIGSSTIAVTLSPKAPDVTLNGTIDASAPIGSYNFAYGRIARTETVSAAVFGTASSTFNIDNIGTVIGTGTGDYAFGIALGAPGTITNAGLIQGYGGVADVGTAAGALIKNAGTIAATGYGAGAVELLGAGSVMNSGLIASADGFGVLLLKGGTIANQAGGTISGSYEAITAFDGGTLAITNHGSILGRIVTNAGLDISNASTGVISSPDGDAIDSYGINAATIFNAGLISASSTGIYLGATDSSLTNGKAGSIAGGVDLRGANAYFNNYGSITSNGTGVSVGVNAAVYNSGTISGLSAPGLAATSGVVYNYKNGVIIASSGYGIADSSAYINNAGTVIGSAGIEQGASGVTGIVLTNTGFVAGTSYNAIELTSPSTLYNYGTIIGANDGVTGNGTNLQNYSAIAGTGNYADAVLINGATASITNTKSGIIAETGTRGTGIVFAVDAGTISNDGTVAGDTGIRVEGYNGYGVILLENTGKIIANDLGVGLYSATLHNTGTIIATGTNAAGVVAVAGSIVNSAAGLISGGGVGVVLDYDNVLNNAGTISGGSYGLLMQSGGQLADNTGLITGGYTGAGIYGQSELLNSGTITGDTASLATGYNGVVADESSTFVNNGLVNHGVLLSSGATLVNAGIITYGVQVNGGGTIVDTGTIIGTGATAIYFASTGGELKLGTSAVIQGIVQLDGSSLELAAGKGGTVSLSNFVNIGTLTVDPGATWTAIGTTAIGAAINDGVLKLAKAGDFTIAGSLSGTGTVDFAANTSLVVNGGVGTGETIAFAGTGDTLSLGDTGSFAGTISGFKAGETVDLTGVTLANITASLFAGGVLTLTGSTATYTYAFSGSFKGETFTLFADGSGTGITLSSTGAKMDFVTPSPAAVASTSLPSLSTAYAASSAKAPAMAGATPSIVTAGFLSHTLLTTTATAPIISLHS